MISCEFGSDLSVFVAVGRCFAVVGVEAVPPSFLRPLVSINSNGLMYFHMIVVYKFLFKSR